MIHKSKERAIEAWEVPTGKHFFSVPSGGILSWSITQDGKKKIFVDGQVHVFDDKDSKRTLNLAGNIFPAISIDGRYLLVTLENESLPHPVIQSLYNCFGVPDSSKATVLYDLDNAVEIAAFANAGASRFSLDNSKIVTATDDSLSIFDLPLTKPWPKIAAYALSVAGGFFWLGWPSDSSGGKNERGPSNAGRIRKWLFNNSFAFSSTLGAFGNERPPEPRHFPHGFDSTKCKETASFGPIGKIAQTPASARGCPQFFLPLCQFRFYMTAPVPVKCWHIYRRLPGIRAGPIGESEPPFRA